MDRRRIWEKYKADTLYAQHPGFSGGRLYGRVLQPKGRGRG